MSGGKDDPRHDALLRLLGLTQRAQSDEVAACVAAAVAPLGLRTTCYLVDEEQRRLRQLPELGKPHTGTLNVEGTVGGRAFSTITTQVAGGPDDLRHLWIPIIDGTERLGVIDIAVGSDADEDGLQGWCETLVNLVGHLIAVKLPYGDALHRVRRTRPMSVASELLLGVLPPLTFRTDRLVISSVLEPSYEVGGDAFDYAVDGGQARFHLLDAMGRGLRAAVMTVTAQAAIRATRRAGGGIHAAARAADAALLEQFGPSPFVTGVLVELDLDSGRLLYLNAGHPLPLLLRAGKAVRELAAGRRLPLGLGGGDTRVGEEMLEPGDRLLLYTDGVVESRDSAGEMFGMERLVDLAERAARTGLPAPETLRVLSHRVVEFHKGHLRDDATLMLIDWAGLDRPGVF